MKVDYLRANLVALAGLLTGASIVHNLYAPDLTIPLDTEDAPKGTDNGIPDSGHAAERVSSTLAKTDANERAAQAEKRR